MSNLSKSHFLTAILLIIGALGVSGCLTAERKETIFTVKPDGSGSGKIIFYNIRSIEEDGKDVSLGDYNELVNSYMKGAKFEDFYPDFLNMKKRLYRDKDQLNGELSFEFLHFNDVGLYRHQGTGPWMYHVGPKADFSVEHFENSNGTVANEKMPVVFWPDDTREFRIVARFDHSESSRSLLPVYERVGTD